MLVRILDHDNGAIDHGADGNGDAAEAHDVGAKAEPAHGGEGQENAHGQHENGDKRTADMQQENDADQRNNGAFFQERMLQGVDRRINQVRAVVDGHDVRPLRQARGQFGMRRFTLLITSSAFSPKRCET